jgi:23S rRNA pseudouridine955/2504/2580 synthase/23S rRNA pseudouridine1911/1915/1917 synthase
MKIDKRFRKKNIKILYEDSDLVALDKPAGLSVTPDRWDKSIPNIMEIFPELTIVHRLDKETSGVMLFAKTRDAARNLSMQFEDRTVTKFYNALVAGELTDDGEISLPIDESPKSGVMMIAKHGKESMTRYSVLERFIGFSWLRIELLTGRTHQIRVHMKAIGYPLAVDAVYGAGDSLFLSEIKPNYRLSSKYERERPILDRVSLHAKEITFSHPITDAPITVSAEIPKDLRITLRNLRKYKSKNIN